MVGEEIGGVVQKSEGFRAQVEDDERRKGCGQNGFLKKELRTWLIEGEAKMN